jgi:polyphosphate kinase 2 (PPK2 family)
MLVNSGIILAKFWLQISPDVQLQRFQERQENPAKAWKLTDEDWRNRDKLPQYQKAIDEMLLRTSTVIAPWTVVEANDKYYSRIKVLNTIVSLLQSELKIDFPKLERSKR